MLIEEPLAHIWLKEMIGEVRSGKERGKEKISEKENQSHFHCLVEYEIHLSSLISFLSPHFLSFPFLAYLFKPNMPLGFA